MSKLNLSKGKNLKINHCDHKEELNKRIASHKSYFYCYKCNNIMLIDNNKAYCTYKLIDDEKDSNEEIEFDPVTIVKNMIQRQEEQIKDINEKLVLNFSYKEESNYDKINSNKKKSPSKVTEENEEESNNLLKNINDDVINNKEKKEIN